MPMPAYEKYEVWTHFANFLSKNKGTLFQFYLTNDLHERPSLDFLIIQ